MTKTLFGFPVVEVNDMPVPVLVLTNGDQWTAHTVLDRSGDEIARGIIQLPSRYSLDDIQRVQERWHKRHRGFEDANT